MTATEHYRPGARGHALQTPISLVCLIVIAACAGLHAEVLHVMELLDRAYK